MKVGQASKIRELGRTLLASGYNTLDEQAEVLGLPRSTTWTILKANHKNSGLSAQVVNRMLASPLLPQSARAVLIEYVQQKAAGAYGGTKAQRSAFLARLSIQEIRIISSFWI